MLSEYKKKYAFISYSHKDEKIAKWLQRNLEAYRLPVGVVNEYENTRYLRPIFRDRTDLNSGKLNEEIRVNLESSKFLIVLCSRHSADSYWVNEEIKTFIRLGQVDNVIPVIVGGDMGCVMPSALTEYYNEHPEDELLAIDLFSEGREISLIRIVSRMLSLEFNVLWDRHRRYKRRKFLIISTVSTLIIWATYWFSVPISLEVQIQEEDHKLPYPPGYMLKVGDAEYQLDDIVSNRQIATLPGYMRMRSVPISVQATYYRCYSSLFKLGPGLSDRAMITLLRDDSFGVFAGVVYDQDGNALQNAVVQVNEVLSMTDEHGHFDLRLPVGLQAETQIIRIRKDGYIEYSREDECPGTNLGYVLRKK
ncbi:MAG: TIR domain-containing protein [Bacteroidales bacterium]|nr:TIR domain-containing protein [Bacteroidales bacterium]